MVRYRGWLILLLFLAAGGFVFSSVDSQRAIPSDSHVYNLIWLDFWELLFIVTLFVLWHFSARRYQRHMVILWALAFFGFLALSIMFLGAVLPDNGYWGDQKFRIAMVQRFMTSGLHDYYFKNLPAFYPPVYYYLLGLLGKIGGHPAYATLQLGFRLLYLILPFALYGLWRKVVNPTCALFVSCSIMLIDIAGSNMLMNVPHAFIANSLFVPWWLHYGEGIGIDRGSTLRRWIVGSLIGALLFATYFYPFFLLAFWLVLRTIATAGSFSWLKMSGKKLVTIGALLAGAAAVSAPYWIPVLSSISTYGMDRTRGDWHHAGSPGLTFPFLEVTPLGILLFGALLFGLWRYRTQASRTLVLLLGTTLLFFMVGSLLGALDHPVNLIKDREFVWALCAPLVGLAAYGIYAWTRLGSGRKWIGYGLALAALLITVRGFSTWAQDSAVERARQTDIPGFGIPTESASQLNESVLLSSNEEVFAFYPAYSFVCINEHYAHPASRFAQRYDFLQIMQRIKSPSLLRLAFRHNLFDPIDYVMAEHKGSAFYFYTALSTYPDKLHLAETKFDDSLFSDSAFFGQIPGPNLYRVQQRDSIAPIRIGSVPSADSITAFRDLALMRARLDASGQRLLQATEGSAWPVVEDCMDGELLFWVTSRLALIGCTAIPIGDSIQISATFRVNRNLQSTERLYLHVYPDSGTQGMVNVEFPSNFDTRNWHIGDLVSVIRAVPRSTGPFGFVLGFFDSTGQYGTPFTGHFYAGTRPARP